MLDREDNNWPEFCVFECRQKDTRALKSRLRNKFIKTMEKEQPKGQITVPVNIELDYEGERLVFNKVKDSFQDPRYGVDISDLTGLNNP